MKTIILSLTLLLSHKAFAWTQEEINELARSLTHQSDVHSAIELDSYTHPRNAARDLSLFAIIEAQSNNQQNNSNTFYPPSIFTDSLLEAERTYRIQQDLSKRDLYPLGR